MVPDENAQDSQGEEEEEGHAGGQHCGEGLIVRLKVKGSGDALALPHTRLLVPRTLLT